MKAVALAFVLCGIQMGSDALGSACAQDRNGIVQLRDEQTIIVEGPLLGGQAKRFAQIVAYLYQSGRRDFTVYFNSEGGSFDEANRIIGAMQAFQERGGRITTGVPRTAICWSFCPMIFSFGDRRFADDETSWMFHRPVPSALTDLVFPKEEIERAIKAMNEYWLVRLLAIDPKFAELSVRNWLRDGKEHKVSGRELRRLSGHFFNGSSVVGQNEKSMNRSGH